VSGTGAPRAGVIFDVLRRSLAIAGIGALLGIGGSFIATRVDPATDLRAD